ncbi:hypothetical protein H5410_040980 [Solanum commersonii]|uniref:Uncharacterized protein n=1 Tax=Solanum commersonii TaxID=4109 RepID=A0A9J5XRP6_SOLCO|nr:hypothetical protein H5410_040980 [Solanum commersonii]
MVVKKSLLDVYGDIGLHHLSWTRSDHAPLLQSCEFSNIPVVESFKFQKFWTERRFQWFVKIGLLKLKLAIREDIVRIKDDLFQQDPNPSNKAILQKASAQWINEGDRNTKNFHCLVKGRRKKLKLLMI